MSAHQVLYDLATADWHIPDPGNGAALPTSKTGLIPLVTGGSGETRTLADPVRSGLLLILAMKTDGGGDCVVTAASDVTQSSGENVMTFGDAGDMVELRSIPVGSGYKWRVVKADGVALS